MCKFDRLGVRSILYIINYKMAIVVLNIERKVLFFIRTEGGSMVDGPGAVLVNQSRNE